MVHTKFHRKNNSKSASVSIEDVVDFIHPFMATDNSFQANDLGRWGEEDKEEFILSAMMGWAPSKFILADVNACLEAAEERGDEQDVNYFKSWQDKGIKYLNIDSHNRNQAIKDFLADEVSMVEGVYEIPGYENLNIKSDVTWSKLKDKIKNYFLTEVYVPIEFYTDASRADLSKLARCVNLGKAWNRPEMRNTEISEVATRYRDLATEFMPYFNTKECKFLSAEELKRRGLDDFMATMGAYVEYGSTMGDGPSITHNIKDEMYQSGSSHEKNFINKASSSLKEFFRMLTSNNGAELYSVVSKIYLYDLWTLFYSIKTKGMKINEPEKMIRDYIDVIGKLSISKEEHAVSPDKKLTFAGMKKLSPILNNMRRDLICEEFNIEDYAIQLSKKRSQTASEKFTTAYKQDFTTPEGKLIDRSRLHTGDYHNGHVTPWKDGGDEFVIQEAKDNLKLGAKPIATT